MIRAVMAHLLLSVLGIPLLGSLPAQDRPLTGQARATAQRASSSAAIRRASDIDFALIHRAISQMNYETGQIRRVRDGSKEGQWVGVRERLHHDVDPAGDERFRLDYVEPEEANITESEKNRRRELYDEKAGFIHNYQGFRVHNVEQAELNYRIYPIVRIQRLGRTAERVLVYPLRWDRSIWLLDLDVETGYPLYSAEYNNRAQLLSEVLVEEFDPGNAALTSADSWKPAMSVTKVQNPRDVMSVMGHDTSDLIDEEVEGLPHGYERITTQVVKNVYGDEANFVSIFSDGIDNVFLVQTPNSENPFQQLGNTISAYRDLNVAQYLFYVKGVRFLVLGRSALELSSTVKAIHQQAAR